MPTNPSDNFFSFTIPGVSYAQNSKDFGMLVTGAVFGTPQRELEKISVPGMNGDLLLDHGKYSNIEITYHCEIARDFMNNIREFNRLVGRSMSQYVTLRDSYDTGHYREGRFVGMTNPTHYAFAESGTVDVTFDCKPQRFVNRGEDISVTTSSVTINNPYGYEAFPMIYVRYAGTLTVTNADGGGHSMTVSSDFFNSHAVLIIDCERKICYAQGGSSSASQYVSGVFPSLKWGDNVVSTNANMDINIWPRWWIL